MRRGLWFVLGACSALMGCQRKPPPSQFPSAADALARMHETYRCSRGISAEAKLDYSGDEGRVKGNVLYMASLPDSVRFDVFSQFGVTLSTLTSDGKDFALFDFKEKTFLYGPANACNVARFTQVPVPPFALAQLLRGEAPVLVHQPAGATLEWDGDYVVRIASTRSANQEIRLEPYPDDWDKPWSQQRIRVLDVRVEQKGVDLWRSHLSDHRPAYTAKPRKDPDGLGPDIPPSGPVCDAQVPRRLRLEVPDTDQELVLRIVSKKTAKESDVSHNPPLIEGVFRQGPPSGVKVRYAACSD